MQGINMVTNESGKAVAVQINLKKHGELWEDIYDSLTAKSRKDEPRSNWKDVKARLRKKGKLT